MGKVAGVVRIDSEHNFHSGFTDDVTETILQDHIGADFHRTMVATAPRGKLPTG